mgnify:CR=1 FL=1
MESIYLSTVLIFFFFLEDNSIVAGIGESFLSKKIIKKQQNELVLLFQKLDHIRQTSQHLKQIKLIWISIIEKNFQFYFRLDSLE